MVRIPESGIRWRCTRCGNLTRFDVSRTVSTREHGHADLGGEPEIEELTVLSEDIQSVRCRWCGNGEAIVTLGESGDVGMGAADSASSAATRRRPLAGVTVLDLTRLLPGNYATLLLAGLGADVIKVEDVDGGDGIRQMMVFPGQSESAGHVVLNRGKRSISVDLKDPAGQRIVQQLVGTADVLIDSFRPGVMSRLGLGPDELAKANQALVHISISAFGQTGPNTSRPAHDLNTAGYAGLLGLVRDEVGEVLPGVQNADLASGLHAALAALTGLRVAEGTGESYRADVAMVDAAAGLLPLQVATVAGTGQPPPVPDYLTGQLACYDIYVCADGRSITVAGLEPKFFGRMTELLGHPELSAQQFDLAAQPQLRRTLADIFASRDSVAWMELLADEDTCVGPVLTVAESLVDANFVDRGTVTTAEFSDGTSVGVFRAVPWASHSACGCGPDSGCDGDCDFDRGLGAPALGQDTIDVLASVGVSSEQLASLIAAGIVRPAI